MSLLYHGISPRKKIPVMPPRRNSDENRNGNRKRKSMSGPKKPQESLPSRIRYFDKEAISEHLHCPICQDVFNYPYALMCGHVFCHGCITEWLKHQRTCPECRKMVDMRYAHKDLIAHKFLDSVPVYCSFLGCSWIGRMDALQSHLEECECNPSKLPDYMMAREESSSSFPGESEEAVQGTTSLRMKLFKGGKRELLDQVASGSLSMFNASAESVIEPRIPKLSDLTDDLVTSSDVIARNRARSQDVDFVELSDDDP